MCVPAQKREVNYKFIKCKTLGVHRIEEIYGIRSRKRDRYKITRPGSFVSISLGV